MLWESSLPADTHGQCHKQGKSLHKYTCSMTLVWESIAKTESRRKISGNLTLASQVVLQEFGKLCRDFPSCGKLRGRNSSKREAAISINRTIKRSRSFRSTYWKEMEKS